MLYKNIRILAERNLSYDDNYVLNLLYLPLIKPDAYALYLKIYNMLDRNNLEYMDDYYSFLLINDLNDEKLIKYRGVLEATGLIKSYNNDSNSLFILLNTPLSAKEFMSHPAFSLVLQNMYSESDFEKIVCRLRVKDGKRLAKISGYNDISKSFDDIFTSVGEVKYLSSYYVNKNDTADIKFKQKFDLNIFFDSVDLLEQKQVNDESFISYLLELAFVYNFTELQMAEAYRMIDKYSKSKFLKVCQKKFQTLSNGDKVKIVLKSNYKEASKDRSYDVSFAQFLTNLSGVDPSIADLNICQKLYSKYHVEPSVINVLIEYALKQNNNVFPHFNYLDKIMQAWARGNVKNVENAKEALSVFDKGYFYSKKNNQKVDIPSWVKNPEKIKKDTDTTDIDLTDLYK